MDNILSAQNSAAVLEVETEVEGDEVLTAVLARQDDEGYTEVIRMQSNADPAFTLILLDPEGCVSTVVRATSADRCRELLEVQKLVESV